MFSKCCHLALVHCWRSKDIRAVLYVNDGIVSFSALELAAGDPIAQVREDISKAGLTSNVHKSCFSPSQRGVWLWSDYGMLKTSNF